MLEVCAGLASLGGNWDQAVGFFSAAEAQASRTGIHRDPADDAFLVPWMQKARAALGEEGFAQRETEGRARAFEEVLAEARAWLQAPSSLSTDPSCRPECHR